MAQFVLQVHKLELKYRLISVLYNHVAEVKNN